jgi:O-antigen/teichoic acid export membrane protein
LALPSISALKGKIFHALGEGKQDSLKGRIIQSAGWMGIGYGVDLVLRLISTVILTRLLDPSAYGLITTVMVFMTVATMISDLGIRPIVLTDPRGDEKEFLGLLWTIQIIRGFALALIVGIGALVWQYMQGSGAIDATSTYGNPLLPQLTLLISLSLIVQGFNSMNELRAIRHLDRGVVSRFDILTRILSTVATVVLVYLFRSVWAMAAAIVLTAALRVVLTHPMLPGPRMALRTNWPEIRKILSMSRWVALNSTLVVITAQADKILFGYAFGLEQLGIYAIAFTLFTSATTLVNKLNNSMGIPVLRALRDKPQVEQEAAYYRFRRPIDLYCIAVGVGMAILGPLFFQIVYDPRYAVGGVYLAVLGIKVVLLPLLLYGNFLMAQMRFKMTSYIGMFRSVIYLSAMALAMYFQSIEAMIFCIAFERLPEIFLYITSKRTGVPFHKGRDGMLLLIAGVITVYALIMYTSWF